jgi:hypothetical protein
MLNSEHTLKLCDTAVFKNSEYIRGAQIQGDSRHSYHTHTQYIYVNTSIRIPSMDLISTSIRIPSMDLISTSIRIPSMDLISTSILSLSWFLSMQSSYVMVIDSACKTEA